MSGKHNIRFNYTLEIYDRINLLTGVSGDGKTLLLNCITMLNIGFGELKTINKIDGIVATKSDEGRLLLTNCFRDYKNKLIVVDEGLINDNECPDQLELLRTSILNNNIIVFINRGGSNYIYQAHSILKMFYNTENDMVVKPILSRSNRRKNNCSLITVEDSGIGLDIYSRVLNFPCSSSFGNRNILGLMKSQIRYNKGIDLMYIVDGSVFGRYMKSIINLMEVSSSNIIFNFIPSLEYLLLKSSTNLKEEFDNHISYNDAIVIADSGFNLPTHFIGRDDLLSKERFYTRVLSNILLDKFGLKYTKSNLDISLIGFNIDDARKEFDLWYGEYWETLSNVTVSFYINHNSKQITGNDNPISFEMFADKLGG